MGTCGWGTSLPEETHLTNTGMNWIRDLQLGSFAGQRSNHRVERSINSKRVNNTSRRTPKRWFGTGYVTAYCNCLKSIHIGCLATMYFFLISAVLPVQHIIRNILGEVLSMHWQLQSIRKRKKLHGVGFWRWHYKINIHCITVRIFLTEIVGLLHNGKHLKWDYFDDYCNTGGILSCYGSLQ